VRFLGNYGGRFIGLEAPWWAWAIISATIFGAVMSIEGDINTQNTTTAQIAPQACHRGDKPR
jgi:hypothetical protein